jgi:hypothetical protein
VFRSDERDFENSDKLSDAGNTTIVWGFMQTGLWRSLRWRFKCVVRVGCGSVYWNTSPLCVVEICRAQEALAYSCSFPISHMYRFLKDGGFRRRYLSHRTVCVCVCVCVCVSSSGDEVYQGVWCHTRCLEVTLLSSGWRVEWRFFQVIRRRYERRFLNPNKSKTPYFD